MPDNPSRSTLTASTLNLAKNIIGAGMLSLPDAMRAAGVIPFVLGIAFAGAVNAYTFFLIGYCCKLTTASSFSELWTKVFGGRTAWIVEISIFLNNGMACVAYCVLIADFLAKALTELLPEITVLESRSFDLLLTSILFLIPLSLLRNLAPLRFSSFAGLAATFYGFMLLVTDCISKADVGSEGGPIHRNLMPVRMDFFRAMALFSSAFMAHYNSPKFYAELEQNTLSRFATVVASAFGIAFAVFCIFGFCGFALFGFGVEGNVLKSYSGGGAVMLAWLGMAFSVIFTYPLVFSTFRDATTSLVGRIMGRGSNPVGDGFRLPFTIIAVAFTAWCGSVFNNVSLVNGVKGAILSACLAFIYPACIHLRLTTPIQQNAYFNVEAYQGPPRMAGVVAQEKNVMGKESQSGRPVYLMRLVSFSLVLFGLASGALALLAIFVIPQTDFSKFDE